MPLFPKDDEPIILQQGGYGDCFVLTVVGLCIYNSGPEGKTFIKSRVTKENNRVVVRLQHDKDLSANLTPSDFNTKYSYHHDLVNDHDVFTINASQLLQILATPNGVKSNADVIPIFEHIVSYYYAFPWNRKKRRGSVSAHNVDEESRHPGMSSARFMGKLLGLSVEEQLTIDNIIKLKTISQDSSFPIYVSMVMNPAAPCPPGKPMPSHALKLEKVFPSTMQAGDHDFYLVNPWDSEKTEIHSKKDLETKYGKFCIYVLNPKRHALAMTLLQLDILKAKEIYDKQILFNILCEDEIDDVILLDQFRDFSHQFDYLLELLLQLSSSTRRKQLYVLESFTKGIKDKFLEDLLVLFPYLSLAKIIIAREADCSIACKRSLAGIALRSKNQEVYDFLVKRNFSFCDFLYSNLQEINSFLSSINQLEKVHGEESIARLEKILQEIPTFEAKSPTLINRGFPINKPVCLELKTQLNDKKKARAAITSCVVYLNNFNARCSKHITEPDVILNFAQIVIKGLRAYTRRAVFVGANRMLGLKPGEDHPEVIRAFENKKSEIEEAVTQRILKEKQKKVQGKFFDLDAFTSSQRRKVASSAHERLLKTRF